MTGLYALLLFGDLCLLLGWLLFHLAHERDIREETERKDSRVNRLVGTKLWKD